MHEAAWAKLEELGFPRDRHSYGHQIGRQVHDAGVWLGEADNPYRPAKGRLQAGMVVTLDPTINRVGISREDCYCVGVEDIALVTEAGGVRLHNPQNEVEIVDW